jgi:hypothetical protein
MSIEAMKQALAALEVACGGRCNAEYNPCQQQEAAQALRTAISEAEKQEPVAWLFQHEETGLTECVDVQQVERGFEKNNPRWQKIGPFYAAPPQRQPLTDEEITKMWPRESLVAFARAIERKHGIGGGE